MTGFAGSGALIRLALRRDRVQLPVWLLGLTGVFAASAASVVGLYDTPQARLGYATTTAANVVARAFNGPTSGPSLGAIAVVETFATTAVLTALMSIFAVVRHTRQNEETGRAELIGAGVVGRYAPLTAAVTVVVAANLVLAGLIALTLVGLGLPVTGAVLTGASLAGTGIAFTGVAAVTAQLAESTRAANGLAAAALGLTFLIRAAGDAFGDLSADGLSVTSAWPSWLSPIGWIQQVRPFSRDDWSLLGLPVLLFAMLTMLAYGLATHRDVGTGMLPVRPGPATAPADLLSPIGLAWRLQRGTLFGWTIGVALTGLAMGAVADAVDELTGQNQQMADLLRQLGGGAGLTDAFFAAMLAIFGIAVAGYTVQALLRMRAEEVSGHLEPVLATAVSRTRWLTAHVSCAVFGTTVLLLVAGATTGLAYGLVAGDVAGQAGRLTAAALAWWPATLALAGFVVLAFGLVPRSAAALSWAGLTACLLMGQIGALLDLPQTVLNLSPFTHVPAVPAAGPSALPLISLTVVAACLLTLGGLFFRRRDITT